MTKPSSINIDSTAVATKNPINTVTLHSEGYSEPFRVDLDHLEIKEAEKGITTALTRGIAALFIQMGFRDSFITSDVMLGSELSSSASIEVLIGTIFNHLFNDRNVSSQDIDMIGQYAENAYFDKHCGLMDQMTCA